MLWPSYPGILYATETHYIGTYYLAGYNLHFFCPQTCAFPSFGRLKSPMKTYEIIQIAQDTLMRRRAGIVAATGADWQADCIRELQITTGLKLDDTQTSCEVSFRAIYSGPDDLGPTRAIWAEAQRLAWANADISKAADLLVDHWLTQLPLDHRCEDLFETLGLYFAEYGVVRARAELYWARVEAFSARSKPMTTNVTAEAVAKVVMLHELAHYVTHQGAEENGRHWESFPSGSDIVEIVAQVATEDVIRTKYSTLLPAFEALLEGAPLKYRDHRRIVKKLREEFSSSKMNSAYAEFWVFFSKMIKSNRPREITSIASLDVAINWLKKSTDDETGLDLTF